MKTLLFQYLVLSAFVGPISAAENTAPNFIVIMAEAQGWPNTSVMMDDKLPASKSAVFKTPALERLASEGMRFAYGYALSPRCTPSRAALFTGIGPAALHMTYVSLGRVDGAPLTALLPPEPLMELPKSSTTVAELLKSAGYTTAHFGKWHVGRVDPAQHGFDASDGATSNGGPDNVASPNPKQAYGITERGIAFMQSAQKTGKSFYLQLSHYPNQERKEGAGGGRGRDTERKDADEIDKTVTMVLASLDRLGLTKNTYVIYTSDHGGQGRNGNEPLSGGKGSLLEGGLRVPFLIRGPGVSANVCSRVPVTACDILPTIAALAGLRAAPAATVEGGSLVNVLRDPLGQGMVVRKREELVFHFPHYDLGNGGPATAIFVGKYKLIRNYEKNSRRLYDIERDPGEAHDLAVKLPEITDKLTARLDVYLKEVNAQMALPNPNYDPNKPEDSGVDERRGGKGGKQGKKRA